MNDFFLVLTGAAISLVSSVSVTWLQARSLRRTELRASARESTRQLTSIFITERDNPAALTSKEPSENLTAAEMTAAAITDRRTRERVRALVRLLRELNLPELQQLSGLEPERARRLICDHALEVLGAHFRSERIPGLPQAIRTILEVEDEALNIHAGGGPVKGVDTPAAESDTNGGGGRRTRRKNQPVTAGSEGGLKKTSDKEKDTDSSEFSND